MDDDRRFRKIRRYLSNIVSYGELVIAKMPSTSLEELTADADPDLLHAATYRLQCLSEAAKNVLTFDPEIAVRHPQIPWQQIRAFGNRLRHEYGDIRADIVWETVQGNDVRSLVAVVKAELKRYADST